MDDSDTRIVVTCMHCGHVIGYKPGHGVTGMSSGICTACLWTHYPDLAEEVMELKKEEATA